MKVSRFVKGFFFLLMVGVLFTTELYAWPIINGVAICTATTYQYNQVIVSDGSGGAIITWVDGRSGIANDVYVQRVNSTGSTVWILNGVALCTAINGEIYQTIASDGAGGAIIAWSDGRSGTFQIYAQHIDSTGNIPWSLNGVAICNAVSYQYFPEIVSDGSGGAIITWSDNRNGADYYIYAQRVNSTGSTLWTTNGVAIDTISNNGTALLFPMIVSDGSGGAIITWQDPRNGTNDYDIYAQRINSNGTTLWTPNGIAICTAANDQYSPQIVSDSSGGAIITWQDGRNGSTYNVYAQRVNSTGSTLWTLNGAAICTVTNNIESLLYPVIVSDGSSGAIITWNDERNGSTYNVYSQRVDSTGNNVWTANGVPICTALNGQDGVAIASDTSGGAIITWTDYRNDTTSQSEIGDIYAQRVNSTGSILWTLNGVAICTVGNSQYDPQIVSDGSDGAIITWTDERYGNSNTHIYAQQVNENGLVPVEDWFNYAGDISLLK
jgi:hypothetical protein